MSFRALVSIIARRRSLVGTLRQSKIGMPNMKVPNDITAMMRIVQAKPRGMVKCWKTRKKVIPPSCLLM